MESINNLWPVASGVIVGIVYTWILVWWVSAAHSKNESRIENQNQRIDNLEKENAKHQDSYKSGDEKLWQKINEVEKKIDLLTTSIQAQLMLITSSLGEIKGRMESGKKR